MSSNRSTTSMSKHLRPMTGSVGLVLAALVVVAGCGGSKTAASGSASAAQAAPPSQPAAQSASPSPPAGQVPPLGVTVATRTTSLGSIVVDSSGRTLYRFDKDTPGSGSSACNAACASTWPPAPVSGQPKAGLGVAGSMGKITRADGSQQVTLDGHPLYRFSGDQVAGDTNGNGFGGIWHVVPAAAGGVTADATAVTTAPSGH